MQIRGNRICYTVHCIRYIRTCKENPARSGWKNQTLAWDNGGERPNTTSRRTSGKRDAFKCSFLSRRNRRPLDDLCRSMSLPYHFRRSREDFGIRETHLRYIASIYGVPANRDQSGIFENPIRLNQWFLSMQQRNSVETEFSLLHQPKNFFSPYPGVVRFN